MAELTITSPEFDDGARIPDRYGYEAENVNPPLEIDGVPDDAETLALIVDDPDAVEPAGKVWDHWLVWNVPADETTITEGWSPDDVGAEEATNDYGKSGYGGPNPPDAAHTYRFTVFAVTDAIDPGADPDGDALRDAMAGRVIERATLKGTYPA